MGSHQYFCLRWNNHQNNMLNVFDQLLHNEAFVDVTLACEGVSLKAHKMVLSACSPYFQTLFMDNPCTHPIVILKDIAYNDMKALVDFMYKGEVNVTQDQLGDLLKTAECLKVKGLAEVASCAINSQNINGNGNSPILDAPIALVQPNKLSSQNENRIKVSTPIESPVVIPPTQIPIPVPIQITPPIPPSVSPIPAPESARTLPSTPRCYSPPNKRKRMPPRRRSIELTRSDAEDSDSIHVDTSPSELVETKVEVQDNYSDQQSEGKPDRSDLEIDIDMDSSREENNTAFHSGENESFNSNSSEHSSGITRHLPLALISSSIPSTSRLPSGNQGCVRWVCQSQTEKEYDVTWAKCKMAIQQKCKHLRYYGNRRERVRRTDRMRRSVVVEPDLSMISMVGSDYHYSLYTTVNCEEDSVA